MRANNLLGIFCGLLVFVPYHQWRFAHAIHHATSGDLDRRGTGDIITLTVEEYLQRTSWGRFKYRVYRHPLFLFCVAPMSLLLVGQRFVNVTSRRRERYAVYGTNLALLAMFTAIWLTIGLKTFVLIYAPVLLIASMALVYGFYVQHQFEEAYWQHHAEWDYVSAALQGSSYFKLPRVLQWFSGNIGLHHVHHLNSRIPNYALQQCHDDNAFFHQVTIITLRSSLKSLRLHLWDAKQGRLISFGELKTLQQQRKLTGET
jgi:omega-6 fatty acid desaturase (delta-12 desaturase)